MIVEENLNISHTVNIPRKDGKVIIEVQIDGSIDLPALKEKFESENIQVEEITRTSAKSLVRKEAERLLFTCNKGLDAKDGKKWIKICYNEIM